MTDSTLPPDQDPDLEPDPLYLDSRREAGWILLMWFCCFVWTLSVCLAMGYPEDVDPAAFATILGIPAWVALGIVLPWMIANVVTIWFCMYYMKDAELPAEGECMTAASGAETGESSHD